MSWPTEWRSLASRLEGFHRRTVRAELDRFTPRVFELRAHVRRNEVAALDPLEPVPLQNLRVLCFQQSAGNSAGPEVDVASPLSTDRILDRDIGDLDPPTGSEHPEDLGENRVLVRDQVEHTIRDHDVEARIRERQLFRLALDEFHVRSAHFSGGGARV